MRNDKVNIDSRDVRQALKTELLKVLSILKQGDIPSNTLIEKIQELLKTDLLYEESEKNDIKSISITESNKNEIPGDIFAEGTNSVRLDISIFKDKDNLQLLKDLVFEKLIPADVSNSFIVQLKNMGLVAALMFETDAYYAFTSQGWNWISSNETKKALTDYDMTFVIPDKTIPEISQWNDKMLYQIVSIRRYYKEIEVSDFMVFSDNKRRGMQFGCEISDSYETNYCYAAQRGGEIGPDDALRLYEISSSGAIKELKLLVRSESEKNRLKMQKGLDDNSLNKLRYFILSEE